MNLTWNKADKQYEFDGSVEFLYSGQTNHADDYDFFLQLGSKNLNNHHLNFKFISSINDLAMCFESETFQLNFPRDPLSYENENEPTLKETRHFRLGATKERVSARDMECKDNLVDAKFEFSAKRSVNQMKRVADASNPYSSHMICKYQTALFAGDFVAPTNECFFTAVDQTNLEKADLTISYKVHC